MAGAMNIHECRRWLLRNAVFYGVTKKNPNIKKTRIYIRNSMTLEEMQRQSRLRHKQ